MHAGPLAREASRRWFTAESVKRLRRRNLELVFRLHCEWAAVAGGGGGGGDAAL